MTTLSKTSLLTFTANSLVAVGDEEGCIRLLESANGDDQGFSKAWLVFKPHANAILDLHFSSDDKLLATASGDQTALVVDMPTQTSICTLSRHASSVKQVRFQPGSGDTIIATSSRDGNVNIWDLRCQTQGQPVLEATTQFGPDRAQDIGHPPAPMQWASITNQIRGGHTGSNPNPKGRQPRKTLTSSASAPSKPDSVTSLEFLRPQIFVTASESNACVKVWDMRISYSHRRGQPVPVSTTREPESHQNYRQFGLTSMTLSGDKARLYTVCRDNTIYAYSTSHLILGSAPELNSDHVRARRYGDMDNEGLGPLYGLRHPRFHVATFYVKSSLRKAVGDNTELLAVGSSDSCAVLFPTDERLLRQMGRRAHLDASQAEAPSSKLLARPSLACSSSGLKISTRLADTISIYADSGTCLTAGHQKEVGGVTWTQGGSLVTVSDDFRARCWREGSDARDLRKGGESGGARWKCGWAEVDEDSDVEEA
jgi:WD40 repeat protein